MELGNPPLLNICKLFSQSKTKKFLLPPPEVPRLICKSVRNDEYFRRGNNSLLKQSLILIGQLVFEEKTQKNVEIQICDRTLFDHWAYSLSLFNKEIQEGNYTEVYEKLISEHCRSYDKIFYIPIEFKPEDDGVRESDEAFQSEIDSLIKGLFTKHSIDFTTINGSVHERSLKILENLNLNA